jgi:hypothetical protein
MAETFLENSHLGLAWATTLSSAAKAWWQSVPPIVSLMRVGFFVLSAGM